MIKKNVIISVRTSAMLIIYTSIECENDCFERQIGEDLKIQHFGRGRSVRQNDYYFVDHT